MLDRSRVAIGTDSTSSGPLEGPASGWSARVSPCRPVEVGKMDGNESGIGIGVREIERCDDFGFALSPLSYTLQIESFT